MVVFDGVAAHAYRTYQDTLFIDNRYSAREGNEAVV